MKDGMLRSTVKGMARAMFTVLMWIERRRDLARAPYRLEGTCTSCGKCCEEPTLYIGRRIVFDEMHRRAFLWWQEVINGWHLKRQEDDGRVLVFTCSHYDATTRMCDSYASRPFVCRDYPTNLLIGAVPDFFQECTLRPVAKNGDAMIAAMRQSGIDDDKLVQITKKLHLQ